MTTIASKRKSFQPIHEGDPEVSDRKLRVVIVSDAILGRNGVGTYYLDLVSQLKSRVELIEVIGPQQFAETELEMFSLPMPGDATQRLSWPRITKLERRIEELRPHVIIIPSLGAFSYFAWRYARRHRIPICVVNHTDFDRLLKLYWPGAGSRIARWAFRRIMAWLIRHAKGVAAMNADSLFDSQVVGAALVRIMGTPISTAFLTKPVRPVGDSIRNVIFVGRLAAEKCVGDVLAAASHLPGMRFSIVGDGPLRAMVLRTESTLSNLNYCGWLGREDVLHAIDEADVLVLPSKLETFGTVALEALARRRHVLISNECGIGSWPNLSRGLFTIDRGESLSDAILRLASMPSTMRNAISERSWDAVNPFNAQTLRNWLDFLNEIACPESTDCPELIESRTRDFAEVASQ